MTRLFALLATAGILAAVTVLSAAGVKAPLQPPAGDKLTAAAEAKNPWTGLTPNAAPDGFQFAVVADRTGGHRKGVFSKAVKQVNLLQPEFVLSVGDLAFQQKARARMQEMMATARLMVMVSHDLESVKALCNRAVWMQHGAMLAEGSPDEVTARYVASTGQPTAHVGGVAEAELARAAA